MTDTQQFIISYLLKVRENEGDRFVSPTEIGGKYRRGYHSSWASPRCKKLVEMDYLERNHRGWYRIKRSK